MDLSQIRMVVTDMDGTLLNPNHRVSDLFFELFEQLQKRGIHFVAASGRQYHSMVSKLHPIKEDVIFIAENGALTKVKDRILDTCPLPKTAIKNILQAVAHVPGAHPVLCCSEKAYANDLSPDFVTLLKEYYTQVQVVPDQHTVADDVLKIAIYHGEDSEKFIYPSVRHLESSLMVKVSGLHWVDVSHPKAHKGHALQKVMATHKIESHQLMVFGDFNNDLEMLALAEYSFAMANAHPQVKKVAKYQTSGNDDFGVEKILKRLIDQHSPSS
ncbi:MAG: HAD family hydrolase [Flavobacteriaceae bacterium]